MNYGLLEDYIYCFISVANRKLHRLLPPVLTSAGVGGAASEPETEKTDNERTSIQHWETNSSYHQSNA